MSYKMIKMKIYIFSSDTSQGENSFFFVLLVLPEQVLPVLLVLPEQFLFVLLVPAEQVL